LAQNSQLFRRPAATSGEGEPALEVADGAHRQRKEGEKGGRRFGQFTFHFIRHLILNKYFRQKICENNWRFLRKTQLNSAKGGIITLVFKKNINLLAENC
jgi:hypothetical protein